MTLLSAPSAAFTPDTSIDLQPTIQARPTVRLDGLTKRFSTRNGVRDLLRFKLRTTTTVVDRVTFDVAEGEIVGLLGPNGAGKTTIFKMLSTMILPDEGTASVCGNDIWLDGVDVRQVLAAVSSDERSLNWRLSARENLLLFAALHKVPRRAIDRRVREALGTVGLEATGRKMVAAFSSGMRQRLLIARALLAEPRVLLLDEPTRALDPISAQDFRAFLRRELVDARHCTIILATHNADEALAFCDRIVVLNKGRVLAAGTAAALTAQFGQEHYRIVTAQPHHRAFAHLESAGILRTLPTRVKAPDGWHVVECAISGGPTASAAVLRALLDAGVPVATLERVEPSLADLIARIIGASNAGAGDA